MEEALADKTNRIEKLDAVRLVKMKLAEQRFSHSIEMVQHAAKMLVALELEMEGKLERKEID